MYFNSNKFIYLTMFESLIPEGSIHEMDLKPNNAGKEILLAFGWTGATLEEVTSKMQLFEKTPITKCYIVITPKITTLFGRKTLKNTVATLYKMVCKDVEKFGCHVLLYSGGGAIYYKHIDEIFGPNVKTYTFDSSPVPRGVTHFANWIGSLVHSSGSFVSSGYSFIVKYVSYIPLFIYMYILDYGRLKGVNQYVLKNNGIKKLFINGKKDLLIPQDSLLKYRTSKLSDFYDFDNSMHLEHDTKNPEKYLELINGHISLSN